MKKVLLMGLPNVGKGTVFTRLIRKNVAPCTHDGSASDVSRGSIKIDGQDVEIYDLPGIYSLFSGAENEKTVRSVLIDENPDLIVQVCDAKNLKRSFALTSLLAEFDIPLLLVLNMVDEAAQRGIKVKRHKLEEMLGTAVVETVASEGVGIGSLVSAIGRAGKPSMPSRIPSGIANAAKGLVDLIGEKGRESAFSSGNRNSPAVIGHEWQKRALAYFTLAGDQEVSRWAREKAGIEGNEEALRLVEESRRPFHRPLDMVISRANDLWAESLYAESVYFAPATSVPLLNRIGDMALTPIAGTMILFIILALLYFVIGKFAAGIMVDFLVQDFFGGVVSPYVVNITEKIPSLLVQEMITGRFGLYPLAIVPALGLVLPVIIVFFFAFGFIEDSGYFARLSILLDRLFRKIGLNGKAVLPIVLGFSCVSMATISTRMLGSKRERFIAIFLLSLGIPCSAKLSVILVILAQASFAAFIAIFGVVFIITIASGFVLNRLIPQQSSHFIMEIPPIRIPSLGNVINKTAYRSWMFLKEAVPLFAVSALGLFFAEKIGLLSVIENIAAPIVKGFLGLPTQFVQSLIMGFIRGEAGFAMLKRMADSGAIDNLQLVVAMTVSILFIPCVTNFILIIKEQGSRKAFAIIASVTAVAFITGGTMNYLLRWNNITF